MAKRKFKAPRQVSTLSPEECPDANDNESTSCCTCKLDELGTNVKLLLRPFHCYQHKWNHFNFRFFVTYLCKRPKTLSGVSEEEKAEDFNKSSQSHINNNLDANSKCKSAFEINKKRKIHVDVVDCANFAQSEIGSKVLTNPEQVKKSNKDNNRGLYPRIRNKNKKSQTFNKAEESPPNPKHVKISPCNDETTISNATCLSALIVGFTSASNLHVQSSPKHKLHDTKQSTTKSTIPKSPRLKWHGKWVVPQKNTLANYFTIKKMNTSACHTDVCDDKSLNNNVQVKEKSVFMMGDLSSNKCQNITSSSSATAYRRTCTSKMYSPIKKVTGSIYISESSSDCSQSSVNKRLWTGQPKEHHHVARPLFSSQQPDEQNNHFKHSRVDCPHTTTTCSNSQLSNTFGLLGEALDTGGAIRTFSSDTMMCNYFEHLPVEVVENIFCQLPLLDLCLSCSSVCTRWNETISHRKFIPWKKLYHRLKKNQVDSFNTVVELMTRENLILPSKCLLGFIRFMKDFKPVTANNMTECLSKHDKYTWARALIEERLPDCIKNQIVNPWCLIAALVILSSSVSDISDILSCLAVPISHSTSMEILECLYCIATMLYGLHLKHGPNVWSGMHYRVFYALYLYENTSVLTHGMLQESMVDSSGQQMKYSAKNTSICMTHEQMRIIKHELNPGDVVKIVAFAGTGKTSMLVRYTQLRPDKKFLLLVYNRSVCDYARKQFPHNVTCKTAHGLAYGTMGRRYASQLNKSGLKVYNVTQILTPRKGDNLYVRAKFVIDTLNSYFVSDHDNISTVHVPREKENDDGVKVPVEHAAKVRYVEDAEYLWKLMQDINNKSVRMTHNGYLKLYQMSKPRLYHYDIILIDEAQDLTPAVIDILMSQSQSKILVGDPHQQIYSFCGAINAMQNVRSTQVFYLTQSFRFGPEIAHVAASCLEVFKHIREKTIVGHGKSGSVSGERVGQLAVISRSNFTVFSEAVKKCCYSQEQCRVAFVGGTEAFGFSMLYDIYTLMLSPEDRVKEKHTINHPFIKIFSSFCDLEKYAKRTMDHELLGKINIVKTFHNNLPMCLKKIQEKCVEDITTADVVFSTAHKSKGLEFSTVRVTDDYVSGSMRGLSLSNILPHLPEDEMNLLYVAVTRAKKALQLSPMLIQVLASNGEKCVYPVLSSTIQEGKTPMKCLVTEDEFQPKALTLKKNTISLTDNCVRAGGVFSPAVLTEDKHVFHELLGLQDSDPPITDLQRNHREPDPNYSDDDY